jgi:organic radical activating enzyme
MIDYDIDLLAGELRIGEAPLVLFGAGDLGKLTHHALRQRDVPITCFCDGNPAKQGRQCLGLDVLALERLATLPRDAHVFICGNYLRLISSLLSGMGFERIYDCSDLLVKADFSGSDLGMDPLLIVRKVEHHRRECLKAREQEADVLILKYMDVVVTETCSMKCQDCSNLMQYYVRPQHSDLDLLESAVTRIMGAIDRIYEFRVLGGEPFMNKQVHRVICHLTAYPSVDKVVIYTNATIVPTGENLAALLHPKVLLEITDYGALSRNLERMVATLEANNVKYISKKPVWTDSGRIKFVERSAAVLDDMFANCCVNDILTLLNGKVYRCPFSANGTNLGAIPPDDADAIDLTGNLEGPELRQQIRRLYSKSTHLTACNYCNGRDFRTARIVPAIQTRHPLPLPQV